MAAYALRLSEGELARYRLMAEAAARLEADLWDRAGLVEGAAVADVGCGPGAVSALLGRTVGPNGRVHAVDRDSQAVEAARLTAAQAGLDNVTATVGDADRTGIPPSSVDLVMIRHVLAHNGGREQAVVDHAASLVRPGGCVYVADIDFVGVRAVPPDSDYDDLGLRYAEWHTQQGNDLSVGLRLGDLLRAAGLDAVEHHGRYSIFPATPGVRPPPWAARDALVAAGLATPEDVQRWEAAFTRIDQQVPPLTVFIPMFFAFGRRPAA